MPPKSRRKSKSPKKARPTASKPTRAAAAAPTPRTDLVAPPPPPIVIPPDAVNDVVNWMLEGLSGYEVCKLIADEWPELPVRDLVAQAGEHFLAAGDADPAAIRGFAIEGYREIYRKALDRPKPDLLTALKALVRLEKSGAG
jgi:hypothetical protein